MPEQEFVDPNEQIQSKVAMHQDFIMVWDDVVEERFCNWLIEYLEQTEYLAPRRQNYLSDKQVEMHNFSPGEADYLSSLVGQCALNYIDNYPYLRSFPYMSSCVMLQKTGPREGYHAFHAEDSTWNSQMRVLTWMVYLNDVDEGGETEYLYQQLKVKPKRGRVVIWPGSFTHIHRGNPPMSDKYIATGWFAGCTGHEQKIFSPFSTPS